MDKTLLWHITMSLDGFIAGPDGEMEWAFASSGPNPVGEEVMHGTGAILAGRGWYDVATRRYDGRAGIYGGAWTGPVFVLTHDPPATPDEPGITFLTEDIEAAVATARAATGDARHVEVFGAEVARQCLERGLLDEIAVHVAPVLLGDGVRLYGGGAPEVRLERTFLGEAGPQATMRFRVLR